MQWYCREYNNRFALMHDVLYSCYRSGMDVFFENGRSGIINNEFSEYINTENYPMIMRCFQGGA
jgi:hypothetical protein